MKKVISRILLMNISKWKKAHNKGIFTSLKMRPVNCEEIVKLPVLGMPVGSPLSVLTHRVSQY